MVLDLLADSAPNIDQEWLKQLGDVILFLLSSAAISGINIIASGQLLGFILGLTPDGTDHFTIRIPLIFHLELRGRSVTAGFAAFAISLFVVGYFLSDITKKVFIDNLEAATTKFTASQMMATTLSVSICVLVAGVRHVSWQRAEAFRSRASTGPSEDQRVKNLTRQD